MFTLAHITSYMQIDGKGALVTGGASGLGAATARRLHMAGAQVVIADLNADGGQSLAKELGPRVLFVATDVTREDSMAKCVEAAAQHHNGLHILVNCAGVASAEKVVGRDGPHSLESFARVIQINLLGTFNALRLAAAAMAGNSPDPEGERGVIINTSSVSAFEGQVGQVAYAASKGGVAALTLPAARELAGQGIRVNSIAPGTFDTPLLAGLPEKARRSLAQQVPFPSRLGRPDEFAALVQHLVENVMLNGETVRLDGALRMAPR